MKKIFIVFFSIALIAGLSLISCERKEPVTKEKAVAETTGYGEKAGEVLEKAQETVSGYGEKVEKAAEKAIETASVSVCNAPIPNLLDAVPGDRQITITWSDRHTGDPAVTGYNIYYDQAGKSQPVTSVPPQTMYTDTGLTNGQEYCYKVRSLYVECESGFSNITCAVPAGQ